MSIAKKKIFHLNKIGNRYIDFSNFGKELIENLGDDIFTYRTKEILLYNILKQISPINKKLEQNLVSIEIACSKIMNHFGLDKKPNTSISILKGSGFEKIKTKEELTIRTCIDDFCEYIIGIDKVPAHFYDDLIKLVNDDLIAITELIKWYESFPCIQKFIRENEVPKSHVDRIQFDFYQRCIKERINIINFQLFDLKEKAISKARHRPSWLASWMVTGFFGDRHYQFGRRLAIHYFDSREIDLVGHRIDDFTLPEGRDLIDLYSKNKEKFYKIYFKAVKTEEHFKRFKFYLPHLPLSVDRDKIFNELEILFKRKRWMSFYALALPQVEGLFNEMCKVISPDKDLSQKSLTQKVSSVRPYHYLSSSYFDYYEYHIPLQRNRFAHSGYDDDLKLKSFDLLVDLVHLLKVFYELDNPLVKIKQMHLRRNPDEFLKLKAFVYYFELISELKPKQKKDIEKDLIDFEKEFLTQNCGIEFICYEMMQDLPKLTSEFVEGINKTLEVSKIDYEIDKMYIPQIEKFLKQENHLKIVSEYLLYNKELIEMLCDYCYFLANYKLRLPNLESSLRVELEKIKEEFGEVLKKVEHIENMIQKSKK